MPINLPVTDKRFLDFGVKLNEFINKETKGLNVIQVVAYLELVKYNLLKETTER
jgi:hypothetical protein